MKWKKGQVKYLAYMPPTRQNQEHLTSHCGDAFVDAGSNTGFLINEKLAAGVTFRIMDVMSGKLASLKMWEDKAELEATLMYSRKVCSSLSSVF